jgi:hypothetical protein
MPRRWPIALFGLFISAFSLLALSGPGRIDIIDGQARYEVARSLVEHGDFKIRDPNVWYPVLPGRDGELYTPYRLPHSLLGVPAIMLSDATGPTSEARRHFFFALIGAAFGAGLAVTYALWFRAEGLSPIASIAWAAAGIFCTPLWYYSTSTFDDAFGAATVVAALFAARQSRDRSSNAWATVAGLAIGLAFNFKQPLAIFVLPVLAIAYDQRSPWRTQAVRMAMILGGLSLGFIGHRVYEGWIYPEGVHADGMAFRPPVWGTAPVAAFAALIISPSCGILWYSPTILLSVVGLRNTSKTNTLVAGTIAATVLGFTIFIALLGFFKGDIGWGPRYLTPVIAVLWLFTPRAAGSLGTTRIAGLLSLGFILQLLALAHDPHRCYIRTGLKPIYQFVNMSFFYDLRASHLFQRPGEVWDSLTETRRAEAFTPAPSPTYALPLPDPMVEQPDVVWRYQVFNQMRPWWACQWFLAEEERPVNLRLALVVFASMLATGGALLGCGLCRPMPENRCDPNQIRDECQQYR